MYNFPQGANKHKFQYKWLCEFKPWLVYSVKENGGFSLPVAFLLPHTMALILAFLLDAHC